MWILSEEKGETTVLKYDGGYSAKPSSGGWFIREGNFVTLAEMFRFGFRQCTAFDIYKTYRHLEIFIHKRR